MGSSVLVDTSAWIEFFRHPESAVGEIVDELLSHDLAVICGVVRAELLQGTQTPAEYQQLDELLDALSEVAPPPDLWSQVARTGFHLKRNGVHKVGIPDLIIAVTVWHGDVALLTLDKHFQAIASVRPLHLVAPCWPSSG